MSDWILVPCLVALRGEFNAVSPGRDRGADGSIGDSAHTSSSDHTPDEDSDILRDHDADSKNEVHALDIDSSGPWPEGFVFVEEIRAMKGREFARGAKSRLQYAICDGMIANIDVQGGKWREYRGPDPHTNHAHMSARYTTAQENDTGPWGIARAGDDMSVQDVREYFQSASTGVKGGGDAQTRADRDAVATLVRFALGLNYDEQTSANMIPNRLTALSNALSSVPASTSNEVLRALGSADANTQKVAAALRAALGSQAAEVGRLLAA